jgi:hypothetical protein
MSVPEARFTHRSAPKPSLERNRPTPPLKSNHHRADPKNTPKTSTAAEVYPAPSPAKPSPAKIAAKERIVKGLVIVSKNVEAYGPANLRKTSR